jgi:hypothetical protein
MKLICGTAHQGLLSFADDPTECAMERSDFSPERKITDVVACAFDAF